MSNKLEILEASYWEHYKFAKDLSTFLPLKHPKRQLLEDELNKQLKELNKLKSQEIETKSTTYEKLIKQIDTESHEEQK